ncbi:hypothetical protein FOTG_07631 [Fusarium oxysporum f. sp. vasinfectum 25433]|uniref:Uncharacterized protein n=1 Tax=Fusarium oxysporum f. sp. vasinfectum 25433 TaxID=1089449 RepID=X0MZZ1_FUSOX|nr:hypothetical protein FOTG_07631 [Fusarium oxysporum f. sp. vasinfectum 25433]
MRPRRKRSPEVQPRSWYDRVTLTQSPRDAEELVSELEFVWNQIKNNSPSSSLSSPRANRSAGASQPYEDAAQASDAEGPMKEIRPMSEYDEAELRSQKQLELEDDDIDGSQNHDRVSGRWQRKVERALTTMSAEVAALREQITTGREWRAKKERSLPALVKWFAWVVVKHLFADFVILTVVLLWLRKRKDRRLEDLVRAAVKLVREYVRNVLPSRG